MDRWRSQTLLILLASVGTPLLMRGQSTQTPDQKTLAFDAVSIKRNTSGAPGNNIRTLPDGTYIATNVAIPIRLAIPSRVSVPMLQILGLPEWAQADRYDITAKPPDGFTNLTAEQRSEMWRSVFVDRLKLQAHVDHRAPSGRISAAPFRV